MFDFLKKKIEVFVRYCHFSDISYHKKRPQGFCRKRCFENLLDTADLSRVNFTFLLDTCFPIKEPHFITKQKKYPVIHFKEGTESGSFLRLLEYVKEQNFTPDTILYFLEDDYVHRPNWVNVLVEGFTVPNVSYVTLFDHRDKYELPAYLEDKYHLFCTPLSHWRSTPSTTNTYAMKMETLLEDFPLHRRFSEGREISADHEKFVALGKKGRLLISPIPGWSTHVESVCLSPCVSWEPFL